MRVGQNGQEADGWVYKELYRSAGNINLMEIVTGKRGVHIRNVLSTECSMYKLRFLS